MIERITEGLVVQVAKEWAARRNKSVATAVANAQETMVALKVKLSTEEYDQALAKLYREYNGS
jgi:hypothetical protein